MTDRKTPHVPHYFQYFFRDQNIFDYKRKQHSRSYWQRLLMSNSFSSCGCGWSRKAFVVRCERSLWYEELHFETDWLSIVWLQHCAMNDISLMGLKSQRGFPTFSWSVKGFEQVFLQHNHYIHDFPKYTVALKRAWIIDQQMKHTTVSRRKTLTWELELKKQYMYRCFYCNVLWKNFCDHLMSFQRYSTHHWWKCLGERSSFIERPQACLKMIILVEDVGVNDYLTKTFLFVLLE